jgi:hypothetical protein
MIRSGILQMNNSDFLGLLQPLTKLIEAVSAGIGTLYEPIHIKRIASANADGIKTISKAIKETNGLSIAYHNDNLSITLDNKDMSNTENISNNEESLKRVGERIVFQEIQKQQNIDTIVYVAWKELEKEQSVSEEPVDKSWSFRFFQDAANVCEPDVQEIWGKILAGEVKQPRSCSLRTLETLKNISKKEAELFTKISNLVLCHSNYFVPDEKILYEKCGITFDDFLNVKEYGLIDIIPMLELRLTVQKDKQNMLYNKQIVGVFSTIENSVNMSLPQIPLTEAGTQLYKILNLNTNRDFALDYFKLIKDKYKTINVTAHNITKFIYDANIKRNGVEYEGKDLLQPDLSNTTFVSSAMPINQ